VFLLGDPTPYLREDGTIEAGWEKAILGWAKLPAPLPLSWDTDKAVTRFRCHKKLARLFEAALERIHSNREAWATVNDFGGAYNFRMQRGSRTALSAHAWGAAIDLDVCDNPQGKAPRVHPWVVDSFEVYGFYWGGRFSENRRDGMHYEVSDETVAQL
jgi:hypothetical protein